MVVGIDVAKADLVVAARPGGERWTVENDERGVRTLVDRFRIDTPDLIGWKPRAATSSSVSAPLRRRGSRSSS